MICLSSFIPDGLTSPENKVLVGELNSILYCLYLKESSTMIKRQKNSIQDVWEYLLRLYNQYHQIIAIDIEYLLNSVDINVSSSESLNSMEGLLLLDIYFSF